MPSLSSKCRAWRYLHAEVRGLRSFKLKKRNRRDAVERVVVDDVARGLGMSKRTLARKLSDEGLNFTARDRRSDERTDP